MKSKSDFEQAVIKAQYTLLGEYKNSTTKVELRCDKGHVYSAVVNSFKQGHRCPKCAGCCPVQSRENFEQAVIKAQYTLLGEYKNSTTKVELRCDKGHLYSATPNNFKQGRRCPKCSRQCPEQSKSDFEQAVIKAQYTLLGEYKNNTTKVELRCDKEHVYKVTPHNFKAGNRCPKCSTKGFNKRKPATLYVLKIQTPTRVFYKLGIANKLEKRVRRIQDGTLFDVSVLHTFEGTGLWVFKTESRLKRIIKKYPSGVKLKEMTTGYTETFSPDGLQEILKAIKHQEMK